MGCVFGARYTSYSVYESRAAVCAAIADVGLMGVYDVWSV